MGKNWVPDANAVRQDLRPLIKSCSCSKVAMMRWLSVPDFVQKVDVAIQQGVWITDESVLPIMREVYDSKMALAQDGKKVDFNFQMARSSMNQIKKALESQNNSNLAG